MRQKHILIWKSSIRGEKSFSPSVDKRVASRFKTVGAEPSRLCQGLSVLFCTAALAASPSAPGHHSFAAYDGSQTRTLKGTIESFQWANPHVVLKMLVIGEDGGEPQEWNIVTSGPAILARFGWTQGSIKPGDRISAVLSPMSDGSHGGRLHTLTILDTGKTLETKLSAADKPTAR
jgi:Family of unknown function (DUF6152)